MNKELTKKLISTYPVLFGRVNKPLTENLISFGIECNSGWYQILDALCIMIDGGHTSWCNGDKDHCWPVRLWNHIAIKCGKWNWRIQNEILKYHTPRFEFMQIKEKYGALRVYLGCPVYDDDSTEVMKKYPKTMREAVDRWRHNIDGAIILAEDLSSITCEDCGMPGELCQRGLWVATMCPGCMSKEHNKGYVTCREYAEQIIDKSDTEGEDDK